MTALVLENFLDNGLFSLETLNSRKKHLSYGYQNAENVSVDINLDQVRARFLHHLFVVSFK
jgi:hypothetical protein